MQYQIKAPVPDFSGTVAGVAFTDGAATLDTAQPTALAALGYFQRKGYVVEEQAASSDPGDGPDEAFDPAGHDASAVLAYLDAASDDEATRVLAAEAAGKARKTILARQRASDQEGAGR